MSSTDNWLILKARQKKLAAEKTNLLGASASPETPQVPPIDHLWASLQEETLRMAKVYADELGDPEAVVIETTPDSIEARSASGKTVIFRVDRERRRLNQEVRTPGGGVRGLQSPITFTTNAEGEAVFSWGGVSGAAGAILRRVV